MESLRREPSAWLFSGSTLELTKGSCLGISGLAREGKPTYHEGPPRFVPMAGITNQTQMGSHNPATQCSRQTPLRKQSWLMRWDQFVIPQSPWLCHYFLLSKSSSVKWAGRPLLPTLGGRKSNEHVGAGLRQGLMGSRAGVTVPLGCQPCSACVPTPTPPPGFPLFPLLSAPAPGSGGHA